MSWTLSATLSAPTDEELSFAEIQERMHVPEEDVTRLTHSLSCAKYKILNKSPASKTVSKTDVFSMNKKFTDRMRRIRVSGSLSVSAMFASHVAGAVALLNVCSLSLQMSAAVLLMSCSQFAVLLLGLLCLQFVCFDPTYSHTVDMLHRLLSCGELV